MIYYFSTRWTEKQKSKFLDSLETCFSPIALPLSGEILGIEIEGNRPSYRDEGKFEAAFGWDTSMWWRPIDYVRTMVGVVATTSLLLAVNAPPVLPMFALSWAGGAISFVAPAAINKKRQERLAAHWETLTRSQLKEVAIQAIVNGRGTESDFRYLD